MNASYTAGIRGQEEKLVTCIFYNQEVEFKLPTHHIPPAGLDMLGLGESRS